MSGGPSAATDYRKFSNLGRYLIEEVGPRFRATGAIDPVDMFMIFIWKANRENTRVKSNIRTLRAPFVKTRRRA